MNSKERTKRKSDEELSAVKSRKGRESRWDGRTDQGTGRQRQNKKETEREGQRTQRERQGEHDGTGERFDTPVSLYVSLHVTSSTSVTLCPYVSLRSLLKEVGRTRADSDGDTDTARQRERERKRKKTWGVL